MTILFVLLYTFFVQFTNKAGSEEIALSDVAIEKRIARGIAIDSLDYAVSPSYIDSLATAGCRIYHSSRWMNGVSIETDSLTIERIKKWPFVDSIYLTRKTKRSFGVPSAFLRKQEVENSEMMVDKDSMHEWASDAQLEQLQLHLLHEAGFKGQGITICVIDGGFQNVDTLSAFAAVRNSNRLLGIYDTTDDEDSVTGNTGGHGSKCWSAIAASTQDYKGAATAAQYYLIRSEEHYTESPKEMDNWVVAIEIADSLGVDIVSSSLGYAMFDDAEFTLEYADLNGKNTRCTQAAQIATAKGMLVVVAAGNEGNKAWHYISAPADAENILTVGAVNVHNSIANFSSYGPTYDGRIKPEVCATGNQTALINPLNNSVVYSNGTSFACPIIAGMAACLWSALPDASNLEIRKRIIQSADRYTQPHDHYGYGIPNAWVAYGFTTSTPNIQIHSEKAKKVLINGQLWIQYNGILYNLMGQKKG